MPGPHPSHVTRSSDASSFDEICINCGAHDEVPGGWGMLEQPCPENPNWVEGEKVGVKKPDQSETNQ